MIKRILPGFIFILLYGIVFSQTDSLPNVWSLQQCIDYAKQHNIDVNTLRLTKKTNEQNLLLAKAAKQPNLTGSVSQTLTASKNANLQTRAGFSSSYGLSSSVTLYNGGYLNNDIRQKNLQVQASGFDITAMENDISLQISQAYLNILLAKENIVYLKDLLETSQSQLQQSGIKYKAGSISKKDFISYEAQVATDHYNLITAQNTERQNTLTLKQLLLLPSGYNMQIEMPDTLIATSAVAALDQAQAAALAQRPEIKSSQLNVDIAQIGLLKAKASGKPTLTGNGSITTDYSSNTSTAAYIRQLDNNFYQSIGLSLSIPIFNRRAAKTEVENAKIAIDQAKLDLKSTETTLSQAVEQAYIDVLNAQAQYDASVQQLTTNKENYEISGEQLRLGAITPVDYLVQKNLYIQALQEYIQAKYNAVIAIKIYDFYKGNPLTM
ncbi:MAG: TolC family protein [Niabella sp.]